MSDYDRGPYTPGSDPPLAFDDRRPARRGGPAPVTLIVSVVLLLLVGGGVYFVYRGGARAPGEPPQPVGAPVRDVKIAAPPTAQSTDPAAGLSIYKDGQDNNLAAPAFVPPPEQPTPRPVAPVAAAPMAPAGQPAPAAAGPVAAAMAPSAVAPQKPAAKPAEKPQTIDKILADNSDVRSPTKPLTPPTPKAPPAADKTAKAPVKPAPAAAEASAGSTVVQIGAFSSKDLADSAWNAAAGAAPGAMAGRGKHVAAVTRADGKVLYRTAITGFATHADAVKLCARLQAAGQSCIVK